MIFTMEICIFERSNEKSHFSKNEIYFHKKTTPQSLEHIGLQNMKVGEETNFGRLATIFQICSMDAVRPVRPVHATCIRYSMKVRFP